MLRLDRFVRPPLRPVLFALELAAVCLADAEEYEDAKTAEGEANIDRLQALADGCEHYGDIHYTIFQALAECKAQRRMAGQSNRLRRLAAELLLHDNGERL